MSETLVILGSRCICTFDEPSGLEQAEGDEELYEMCVFMEKKDDLINLMLHFMCVFCFSYVAVQIQKNGVTTRSLSIFKIYGILFYAFYTMSLLLFYGRTRCGKKTIQMAIVRFPGLNIKE